MFLNRETGIYFTHRKNDEFFSQKENPLKQLHQKIPENPCSKEQNDSKAFSYKAKAFTCEDLLGSFVIKRREKPC